MVVQDDARTGAPLLLDVATVDSEKQAHVTTQGPTAADQKKYDALPDYRKSETSWASIKVEREDGFPKAVLEQGFRVDTFHSEASVAIDRRRILNAICGVHAEQLDAFVPPQGTLEPGQNMVAVRTPAFSAVTQMGSASFHQ